jgi:hypothetical protein
MKPSSRALDRRQAWLVPCAVRQRVELGSHVAIEHGLLEALGGDEHAGREDAAADGCEGEHRQRDADAQAAESAAFTGRRHR